MMMNTQHTCASCHGVDARGGIHTMLMQVMEAPDIRWSVLASEGGEENDEGGEHGDEPAHEHTSFDLEAFRLAVVEGKHSNSEVLSYAMPR